ncbi:uncharacterized protein Polr3G [Bemisia tabaci]|uniref:uncharacterized protein Polr3G n=1 Tax=Bemisia tabaci TaxID=7038 RepID=UPI0008F99284|nr:PREDICTED: DNA-directed RNA polymerase III subunit RPC7-like [Bemisia tabaci]
MAGRGRGRAALSFAAEQIGIAPGEALPGPVLQPPPLFPGLEFHPAELDLKPEYSKRLRYKKDILKYFSRSEEGKEREPRLLNWDVYPSELKPHFKKPAVKKPVLKRKANLEWLDALEKSEESGKEEKAEEVTPEEGAKEEGGEEEGELGDEEEADEEMDDGTDYNENYFDNGEGYLDDEDDNLDDGPIY